ncbi:MAG TPA: chromate transporter [Stellaceae bacterium]|nr:chromate transporter [Stellaceae bacterium]
MNAPGASISLVGHIALLALISFGGVPGVLPDLRNFVVTTNGWLTDQEFANCFAIVQAIPGPNMILMMSFIGWKVGGLPTAVAAALVTFGPSCAVAYAAFHYWERFRDTIWQSRIRRGLTPVIIGLVTAGGYAMARTVDAGWIGVGVTVGAGGLLLGSRINPLWLLGAGAVLGGLGLV